MRFQVYITDNQKVVNFDERQSGKYDMYLRNATIFWKFNNIVKDKNDQIRDSTNAKVDTISPGYHSFQDLQAILKANKITMTPNYFDNTANFTATQKNIKLGELGVMLGLDDKNVVLKTNIKKTATKPVDVHHGLRYVKLSADIVDKSLSNFEGKRSDVFAALPIDTSQRLFSSRTVYSDLDLKVPIVRNFSSIEFKLSTNIDSTWPHVKMDALLDIDIA